MPGGLGSFLLFIQDLWPGSVPSPAQINLYGTPSTIIEIEGTEATAIELTESPRTVIEIERELENMSLNIGDSEIVRFKFKVFDPIDETRVLTDPDRVRFHVERPDKTSFVLEFGVDSETEINRIGEGIYWARVPFPMAGRYRYLAEGTAPAEGTEPGFLIVEPFVPPFATYP